MMIRAKKSGKSKNLQDISGYLLYSQNEQIYHILQEKEN